ncbi:MAG: hypothetical protein ACJAWL_000639 [Motiliproteus sp.]|jgi:hypothetical protein
MDFQLKVVVSYDFSLVPLDETLAVIPAQTSATYTLVDTSGEPVIEGLVLKRKGQDLEIDVDGEPVASIGDFYATEGPVTYSVEGVLSPAEEMAVQGGESAVENGIVWQASGASGSGLLSGAVGAGVLALGAIASSSSSSSSSGGGSSADTSAPSANLKAVTDDQGSEPRNLISGDTTNDGSLLLSGTNEAGSTVQVYDEKADTYYDAVVGGTTWSYTASIDDDTTYQFQVIETDTTGNPSAPTSNFEVIGDMTAPTVTSVTLDDSALKAGETTTLTIVFSEAVKDFDNNDITLANGTLSTITSSADGMTWTGTFTPTDDIENTTNVITVGTALSDLAGNIPEAGAVSDNYVIDTVEPVVESVILSNSTLKAGETTTLTIVFSEEVKDFDNTDITLANGTLSVISSSADGITWTGTFTPTDAIDVGTNVISVGTTLTDLAGNAPKAGADTGNYRIDTVEPVVTSVTLDDSALKTGETTTLTIVFSEEVKDFDNTDITLANGTLSAISSSADGVTWTGTFTPTDAIDDATNVITVGTTLTDLAGNAPKAGAVSDNYVIDTVEPTSTSDTTTVVFDFVHGVSSDHDGGSGANRHFESNVSYDIYIMVDSDSAALTTTPQTGTGGANADASWGIWTGAANLGADDHIYYSGNDGKSWSIYSTFVEETKQVINLDGDTDTAQMVLNSNGMFTWSTKNDYQSADIWGSTPNTDGLVSKMTLGGVTFSNKMPDGILTSQGLV